MGVHFVGLLRVKGALGYAIAATIALYLSLRLEYQLAAKAFPTPLIAESGDPEGVDVADYPSRKRTRISWWND